MLVGVTVTVAVTGAFVKLVAVNAPMLLPVPLAAKPMLVRLFVHAKLVVEAGVATKLTAVVVEPVQRAWLAGSVSTGVGATSTGIMSNGRQAGSGEAGLKIAYTYMVPAVGKL